MMISKMMKSVCMVALSLPVLAIGAGVSVAVSGIHEAHADVTVYRALDRKNTTYAKVNDAQFRIDDDGMSTFELANFNVPNKRCRLAITITGVDSKPDQGTKGDVAGSETLEGEYTPQHGGEGHWSIAKKGGGTTQGDITAFTIAVKTTSPNPTYNGDPNSECKTPAEPN